MRWEKFINFYYLQGDDSREKFRVRPFLKLTLTINPKPKKDASVFEFEPSMQRVKDALERPV